MSKAISEIMEIVEMRMNKVRGSHDLEHTKRVYTMAVKLAKKEKADLNIVKLSAILHDIARHKEDLSKGRLCHAKVGAETARKILNKAGFKIKVINDVCHCIRTHRFRDNYMPETIEAKVLFDADKLDSIGAIGIGRAFLFAGEVGAALNNKALDIAKTKPYTEEDTAHREYMVKLRYIKDKLFTKTGKKMASDRHSFMKTFFKRFALECASKK